jgi:hypothetical protein
MTARAQQERRREEDFRNRPASIDRGAEAPATGGIAARHWQRRNGRFRQARNADNPEEEPRHVASATA